MKEFIKGLLSDENGIPSTKRLISLVGVISIIIFMFVFKSIPALDATTMIVLGSLGITGAVSIFGNKK